MKCRKCGAENLDGAEFCNTCRAPLAATSERSGTGSGGHAALWIGIAAAAVFAIVLVVIFANGNGGGGGGQVGVGASPSASPGLPQAKSEKAAVRDAEAFLKKNYPELLKAPRKVSTTDVHGNQVTVVSYSGTLKVHLSTGASAEIPQVVVVTRNATTGRTVYSVTN